MKINLLIVALFFVSGFSFSKELSDFEKMLSGFPECSFDDTYLDLETRVPQNKYFTDRKMKPYKIENDFAYFHVNEKYFGMKVVDISIPASTVFSISIVFADELGVVKERLVEQFPKGFCESVEVDHADCVMKPILQENPGDSKETLLWCFSDI